MINKKGTAEKLRVLIEHWISHNEEHAREYQKWADRIESEGIKEAATAIRHAAAGSRLMAGGTDQGEGADRQHDLRAR